MKITSRYGVDRMSEGDWLVRGTLDPLEALGLIVDDYAWSDQLEDMLDGVAPGKIYRPGQGLVENTPDPEAIAAMAGWCYGMLHCARPGWYRKVHCLPGSYGESEGWAWQMDHAREGSRGAFRGVYFQP